MKLDENGQIDIELFCIDGSKDALVTDLTVWQRIRLMIVGLSVTT
jgi:hypothetical protein